MVLVCLNILGDKNVLDESLIIYTKETSPTSPKIKKKTKNQQKQQQQRN